jgi:diguanylate cyclase (GGDEF)-like protein/PAS domain S-box-containing protein
MTDDNNGQLPDAQDTGSSQDPTQRCQAAQRTDRYRSMSTPQDKAADPLLAGFDQRAMLTLDELPDALIMVFDSDLRLILAAGHALRRGSSSPIHQEGQPLAQAFPADLWSQIEPLCRSALAGDTRSRKVHTADGRHRLMIDIGPLCVNTSSDPAVPAAIAGGVAVVLDISVPKPSDKPQDHPPEHFEQVFERTPIGTGLLDVDGRWVLVNQALCDITSYTAAELIGRHFQDITHPDDVGDDASSRRQLLAGEISAYQAEKRYFNAAGETMSAILSVSLVRDRDENPLHFVVQIQDISERKRLEEHLRHLADHDPLTGLRNRRLFEHDLRLQIGRCQRYGEQAALMVIDLDGFKQVNDRHGHKVGDDALKAVAHTLTRRLRATDLVARLGGDEFAVLLPHMDQEGAEIVAEDLMRVIATCNVDTGETVVHLAGSAGFALLHEQTVSDEQALVEADRSMYAAKRARASAAPAR